MLSDDSYKTLERDGSGLYKEKGSRFLSFTYQVSSEEEIKAKIEGLKKRFYDATHWCYAYHCGVEKVLYRVNDDGEPSGSAGLPIYNQIRSNDLTNVLIVVVRYYGGKKLGTSGLIHAYKTAAQDAIDQSPLIVRHLQSCYDIRFAYAKLNAVMKIIKNYQGGIKYQTIDETCLLGFNVRKKFSIPVDSALQGLSVEILNKTNDY